MRNGEKHPWERGNVARIHCKEFGVLNLDFVVLIHHRFGQNRCHELGAVRQSGGPNTPQVVLGLDAQMYSVCLKGIHLGCFLFSSHTPTSLALVAPFVLMCPHV